MAATAKKRLTTPAEIPASDGKTHRSTPLRDLRMLARGLDAGEFVSYAAVAVDKDGTVVHCVSASHGFDLTGGVGRLHHLLCSGEV